MRRYLAAIVCFIILLAIACGVPGVQTSRDTTTSGYIKIGADEEYKPVTQAEIDIFQSFYSSATIHPVYGSEDSIFGLLMKDSVRLIVANRKLNKAEDTFFHAKQLFPDQYKIATDAIAIIVNNSNPDTLLSIPQLKAIFSGQDSTWKQLNDNATLGSIRVVFDHENSSSTRYIQQNLISGNKFPSYCFTLHSNPDVISYVSKTPNAIGVIGINWMSNGFDTAVVRYLHNVKEVALSKTESKNPGDYFKPWGDNIQTGQYPLTREVYIISREAYTGLGSGFLAFVTSIKGQLVIYRDGLLPIRMPNQTIHY
jgi:phosphate transport system substrate-binding protein